MVSKCANPGCSAPFLYLHQGKLFRLETDAVDVHHSASGADPESKKPSRRIAFYWLCRDCAAAMTLTYDKGFGVTTKPLERARGAAS
jgi:hypothetical protein